jgi:hypothetical protein
VPTRSFSRGRGPNYSLRRTEWQGAARGRIGAGIRGSGGGLVERLHMAGRSPREDRGSHPLERRRLFRASCGLGRYLEAEVE